MKKIWRSRQVRILFIGLILEILFLYFGLPRILKNEDQPSDQQLSEVNIRRVCELATLECFYHNSADYSYPGDTWHGAKKLWLEYDGRVRVGIKGDNVTLTEPDENGIVTVTIPDAVVLDHDLDEDSVHAIDSKSPLWGWVPLYSGVTTEDERTALAEAQEAMVISASQNGAILYEARDRAKKIIEKNIIAVGEAAGKNYKVRFVDYSEPQTAPQTEEP